MIGWLFRRPALADALPAPAASGVDLPLASRRAQQALWTERTELGERVCAFLRQRHPYSTAHKVEAETGIRFETVVMWLLRGSAPSGWAMLLLVCAYGPEFIAAVRDDPPRWVDLAAAAEDQQRLSEQLKKTLALLERAAP
jgi:hypothetical protein